MVPRDRIELSTPAFSGQRSTTELPRHFKKGKATSLSPEAYFIKYFLQDFLEPVSGSGQDRPAPLFDDRPLDKVGILSHQVDDCILGKILFRNSCIKAP